MRYFVLLTLFLGLSVATHAQNIFISSDGAIFMDMSSEWTIQEVEVGVVQLINLERSVDVLLTYGTPLLEQLHQFQPSIDMETITAKDAVILLAQTLPERPDIFVELPAHNEIFWFAHDPDENGTYSYFIDSMFTGITHITINGSFTSYDDILTIWRAYEIPPEPTFDCSKLGLDQVEAVPGAILIINGLPAGLNDFKMQAIIKSTDDVMPLIAVAQEDNSFLTAPLYPDLSLEGGPVVIQAIHNGIVCRELPFTVLPLSEAPGELDRFVDAANRYIDASLQFLDIEKEDILYAPVPDALLPLAEIQFMLDHPDNPDSLVNLLQSASPEEIAFAEALFANDGYANYFDGFADFLMAQPSLPPEGTAENTLYLSNNLNVLQVNEFDILTKVRIPNVEKLSYYMRFQAYWAGVSDNSGQLISRGGLANSSVGLLVSGLESAGKVSSRFATKVGATGAMVSVGLFTASTMIDLYKYLLPSEFTRVQSVLLSHFEDEDNDSVQMVEKVIVSVKSLRWDVTKNLADAVITAIGAAGATRGVHQLGRNTTQTTYSAIVDKGVNSVALADFASNVCGSDCNSDRFSVGPYEWKNIDLDVVKTNGLYINFQIDSRQSGPSPSIRIFDVFKYRAIDDGLTVVRIRPKPAAFGGATLHQRRTISVDKIGIIIDAPKTATPDTKVCATSQRVLNALDKSLDWTVYDVKGLIVATGQTSGKPEDTFCFIMPKPPEDELSSSASYADCKRVIGGGYAIVAESTTKKGARRYNGNELRIGSTSIFYEGEENICEGLWTVTAREELNEFCLRDGVNQVDLQRSIEQLIVSGELNGVLRIEEAVDRSYADITDMLTNETQRILRKYPEDGIEILYGDVDVVGINDDGTQTLEIKIPPRPPKQYERVYAVPVPAIITEKHPLTLNFTFTSSETFVATVSWEIEVNQVMSGQSVNITCDVDVVYDGVYNPEQ